MSENQSNSEDWALIFIGLIIVVFAISYLVALSTGVVYGVYEAISK